jgi:gamma-glutamylcyclotransferase
MMGGMDSHYDQVQQLRAQASGQPSRLYFAYSTILDRAAFDEWRGEHGYTAFELPAGQLASALGVELVYDFPSRWWGGRVAGLADRPEANVHGLLFEIAGADWPIVQHKEGAITGMCVEREVLVRSGGQERKAIAFTTSPARARRDGPVSLRFVEALERGARAAGLPEAYLQTLRGNAR